MFATGKFACLFFLLGFQCVICTKNRTLGIRLLLDLDKCLMKDKNDKPLKHKDIRQALNHAIELNKENAQRSSRSVSPSR